ncbi:MAG: signal peptidase II [Candidatus Omnitrophica bacterium]|nr:signal peptidase II [Candidatus Omnitrophota bacterium]
MPFIIVISILFFDQASKFLVVKSLSLNQSVPILRGIFHISLVHNRGAAFGLLNNQVPVFIAATLLAVVLIALSLKKSKADKLSLYNIALYLILGGALGNLIDRLFLGYVIDFLDFRVWPVFNIADSAITIGAVLLGWCILRNK